MMMCYDADMPHVPVCVHVCAAVTLGMWYDTGIVRCYDMRGHARLCYAMLGHAVL